MNIPEEFKRMVRRFDQASIPKPFVEAQWITTVLRRLDDQTKLVSREFLTELLREGRPAIELQRVWKSGSPEYILSDDDLRTLLIMIKERL